jgi:hypothetical protein
LQPLALARATSQVRARLLREWKQKAMPPPQKMRQADKERTAAARFGAANGVY